MRMRVRKAYPPNIAEIRAHFPVPPTTIFTYAPFVYVPSGNPLTAALEAHEAVHLRQQGDDPAAWWARYLADEVFRTVHELEAHRAEWRVTWRVVKDRNLRARHRRWIARRLSSPLYGSLVTYQRALRLIR